MRRYVVLFVAVLAVIALAMPVLAKPQAKPLTKSVSISEPFKIGGTQLSAGDYKLIIEGDKVTVEQGKQVVATATARWEQREKKADTDAVVIGPNGELQEVRFAGENRSLVFGGS